MKFSTEAIRQMAEIMVSEMQRIGVEGEGMREVERGMRDCLSAPPTLKNPPQREPEKHVASSDLMTVNGT